MKISKSCRLDENILDYIEKFDGDTFTDKLTNLVTFACITEDLLKKNISDRELELMSLEQQVRSANDFLVDFNSINKDIKNIKQLVSRMHSSYVRRNFDE